MLHKHHLHHLIELNRTQNSEMYLFNHYFKFTRKAHMVIVVMTGVMKKVKLQKSIITIH